MHDVPVLHHIVLAFKPHLAGVLGALLALRDDEIVIGDGFGPDEALLEIGMDDAGGLRRGGARWDRPGTRLLRPDGEEGDQAEQLIASANEPVETGFVEAEGFKKFGPFRFRQGRDLAFDMGGDDDAFGAFGGCPLGDAGRMGIALGGRPFIDIADIENRLRGQEVERPKRLFLVLGARDMARRTCRRAAGAASARSAPPSAWPPCRRP